MSNYVPCPKCGGVNIQKVGFTWWGGILGPALFNHVKCNSCGTAYNGKTGQSNTVGITIYILVTLFIVALLGTPAFGGSFSLDFLWWLRDALLFAVFLVGIWFGVSLIKRNNTQVGKWTIVAFALLSIEPISDVILWRILGSNPDANYDVLNWTYAGTNVLFTVLGVIALITALRISTQPHIEQKQTLAQ